MTMKDSDEEVITVRVEQQDIEDSENILMSSLEVGHLEGFKVLYTGLPEELQQYLINYTNEELLARPLDIVRSIIRMHALVLGGGMNELMDVIADNDESIDNKLISNQKKVTPVKEN